MKKNDIIEYIKKQNLSRPLEKKVMSYLASFPEDISEDQMKNFADFVGALESQNAEEARNQLQISQRLEAAVEGIQQEDLKTMASIRNQLETTETELELMSQKATGSTQQA